MQHIWNLWHMRVIVFVLFALTRSWISPPASGPCPCSAAPGGSWGCWTPKASAGRSNTWRRRWTARWCWTAAAPETGAPTRSWREDEWAEGSLTKSRFSAFDYIHSSFWHFLSPSPIFNHNASRAFLNKVQNKLTCPPRWYPWGSGSSRRSRRPGRPRPWRPAG